MFQAGATYLHNNVAHRPEPGVSPTDVAYIELSTNYNYNATASGLGSAGIGEGIVQSQDNGRFSVSYITG